jgi:signal peptide peptidase SppA
MSYDALRLHLSGTLLALREEHARALVEMIDQRGDAIHQGAPALFGAARSDSGASSGHLVGNVGVIPIRGYLSNRRDSITFQFLGGTAMESLGSQILQHLGSAATDSILLDVDSPGGEVSGVTEAAALIREARERKPVVAMVNASAGSSAYWLASQASRMIVTPSGSVGSIGIYGTHIDESAALGAMGAKVTLVSAGKYKVERSPYGPLGDDARAYMQADVNQHYEQFINDVAAGRGVSASTVRAGFGQGRMVGARAAVGARMADEVGTLRDALRSAVDARGQLDRKIRAQRSEIDAVRASLDRPRPVTDAELSLSVARFNLYRLGGR